MASMSETDTPVLHVIVIGFHHKKGCQVEYSYPPVIAGNPVDSHQLPEEWKHLPSLALPDGAHNYQKDTVFFHLPSRDASKKTVYCVSCYRQMDAKDLLNKTADITRSTVQKSVCVISQLPLYGLLRAKLELITHAYFDERDFSKVDLLEQTFNNLNASLAESLSIGSQVFLGLCTRDIVVRFKHKLMVLFKLILLERRVLFFGSPVETLGTTILSILSLYPGMLEYGLDQAVSDGQQRLVSPTMGVASLDPGDGGTGEEFVEVRYHEVTSELSELMPHLHNTGVSALNEPPESPTIPRDLTADPTTEVATLDTLSAKARKEAENRHRQLSSSSRSSTEGGVEVSKASHRSDRARHSELKIHSPHPSLSSQDSTGGTTSPSAPAGDVGLGGGPGSPLAANHSPLEDMQSLTQIRAVQTGRTLPNDSVAVETYVHEVELGAEGYVLDATGAGLERSDSVEELDSPESIRRIDREDCFSWEEDRLQLALSVDEADEAPSGDIDPLSLSSTSTTTTPTAQSPSQDPQSESEGADRQRHSSGSSQASSSRGGSPAKSPGVKRSQKGGGAKDRKQKTAAFRNKLSSAFGKVRPKTKDVGSVELKVIRGEVNLHQDEFGFPLAIFTKGCVCHPYLSLQFHSILSDVNVRSFVLGATNILFRQQKQVTDVIVEVEEGRLEVKDRELQKQLSLTTADLRFAELLVRVVTEEKSNVYLDGTEWEGSDEWVRAQFRNYLQSLLATVLTEDGKLLDDFGVSFIAAWKTTNNYRHWVKGQPHPKMADVLPGHPFQGNLSVTDVRMRLNHSMQSTERGRKINAAVVQTGKYVVQTGKAVGGAFSSARSAVSSWFTSITNDWRHDDEGEGGEVGEVEEKETDSTVNDHSVDAS